MALGRRSRPIAATLRTHKFEEVALGKVTGFLEIDRQEQKYQPASDRIRHFREFTIPLNDAGSRQPGGTLHGLRHPVLPWTKRVSGQQPDPGLE
jgi:hypothetical protein